MKYLLSIDQGTTSSRAILYDEHCIPIAVEQKEFAQYFPESGWVEHDAIEIWHSVQETARNVIRKANVTLSDIAAIGITNQRETIVLWDRKTGEPVARAIVWQDRRTSEYISAFREDGKESFIQQKTGLVLDSYFSASKLHWLLGKVPNARTRAAAGELAAGTIDAWLIYKLTGGREHVTDVTNACRTMLMNIHTGSWDDELLALFDIPKSVLPRIVTNGVKLAESEPGFLGKSVMVCSGVGDQQSALFGQLCTKPGLVKCTYGTGCFMLQFIGSKPVVSKNRLLTTVAWKLGDAPLQYAIEGSVFVGGAAIQWLRDGLRIIRAASEVNELAASVPDSGGVCLVPAFTGLGAPYWDATARGTLLGITRGTTAAHLARATLEGIAYEVTDLLWSMEKDSGCRISTLRVDGGASASNLLMQIQADLLGVLVERPRNLETTALGAAMMAGLATGIWGSIEELNEVRAVDREFHSTTTTKERRAKLKTWGKAIRRARGWSD